MVDVLADLVAETAELDDVLAGLSADGWARPTPADGWTIQDQVAHLAYFDDACILAATDEEAFRASATELSARGPDFAAALADDYRAMTSAAVFDWYRIARRTMIETFRALDPSSRTPWYGPPMSVRSSTTARLMETWAHGRDIRDTVDVLQAPTVRLRHIAHLGVRTFGYSFAVRGREVPDVPVRVELAAPDGDLWSWGPEDAADVVSGAAEDFCLVVTQRKPVARTGLVTRGPVAADWMTVAQAFAGPPTTVGDGR